MVMVRLLNVEAWTRIDLQCKGGMIIGSPILTNPS